MNAYEQKTIIVGQGMAARNIEILHRPGTRGPGAPALLWLGGYRSDMSGTKAVAMDAQAQELGLAAIRFDYSGHGVSGGEFRDGTISRWLEEALAVIGHIGCKRIIAVGSSMGGWIALRLAQELQKRSGDQKLHGLVLIAPAPDFTSELIEPKLGETERQSLAERGYLEEASPYSDEPDIFTARLIEDGRHNLVMRGIIGTGCPVHILQGMKDEDVPYAHALKLVEFLPTDDVVLTLIRDGDHRLSRPQDIERMQSAIRAQIDVSSA